MTRDGYGGLTCSMTCFALLLSGISLLRPIPLNRTCASAHIDLHWCTCLRYENIDVADELVSTAARRVVDHINT